MKTGTSVPGSLLFWLLYLGNVLTVELTEGTMAGFSILFASVDSGHDIKLFTQLHPIPISCVHCTACCTPHTQNHTHCPTLPLQVGSSASVNCDYGLRTFKGKTKLKEFVT